MLTVGTLREALAHSQSSPPDVPARVFPSSFDPQHAEPAFLRSLSWHWQSAEEAIRGMRAKGVMMRLPLFLQYEAPLAKAAHAAGAFIFINDTDNMPLGAAALMQAEIGCVVTTGNDAETFGDYLQKKNVIATGWLLVRHFEEEHWDVPQGIAGTRQMVTQEVHLFPGFPVLVQCAHLSLEQRPRFHAANDVIVEGVRAGTNIRSSETELFPFSDLVIPYMQSDGTCPCGKPVFSRE